MRIVVVTGSRRMHRTKMLKAALESLKPELLMHGTGKGCDELVKAWAEDNQVPSLPLHPLSDGQSIDVTGRDMTMLRMALALQKHGHEVVVLGFLTPDSLGSKLFLDNARRNGLVVKDFIA